MMKQEEVTEIELHAYVDHQLSKERMEEVKHWLASHLEESRRVAAWKAQNKAITARFNEERYGEAHTRFDVRKIREESQNHYRAVAAVTLFILGGLTGWVGHRFTTSQDRLVLAITPPAMAAHRVYTVEANHPVEVDATQEQYLVGWLSKRLDYPLRVPDLSEQGFHLMGGRLLPATTKGAAAQFMFGNGEGPETRVTLYCARSPTNKETAFRYAKDNGVSAYYWFDRGISYAVIGRIEKDDLQKISTSIHQQISTSTREAETVL
jgi:anti-sigma factor RsiW